MKEEIFTFLLAAAPISELRGAIPLGVLSYGFPLWKAYLIAVAGNFILIGPFLFVLEKFSDSLMHHWYFYNRVMTWVFDRTRRKHLDHFHEKKWTHFALFVFVAIPLPMTGAWSGAVAAYLLGIPYQKALLTIFLAVLAAGGIVSVLTSGGLLAAQHLF